LSTLRRAADALDCELVYALIPRKSLVETVHSRASVLADEELARVSQTMALEDQAVPVDPQFREELIEQLTETRRLWADDE
jgi:hypothetical protein